MFYIKEDKKQQSNKCCQLEISAMGKNLHILRSLLDIGHSSNTDFMRRKFKLPLAVNQDYAHFNFRIDTLAHITHVSVRFLLGRNKQEKFVQYIAYSYSRICNLLGKNHCTGHKSCPLPVCLCWEVAVFLWPLSALNFKADLHKHNRSENSSAKCFFFFCIYQKFSPPCTLWDNFNLG